MIGRTVAHYTILAKIGEGGMGEVYRAHDAKLAREVALKVLPGALSRDPHRLERFHREARAVAALNHPNIVTLFSVEQVSDIHLLTMELVAGHSLDRLLPENGFSLKKLFKLAIPFADALQAAHDAGITHRDLKPANVMLTADGRLKVLDFGLAKSAREGTPEPELVLPPTAPQDLDATQAMAALPLTGAGKIIGTIPYMAPEQLRGEESDHRADLFSFGIMVHELATGSRPFIGGDYTDTIEAILSETPTPLRASRADLPDGLDRIIQRCLAKAPSRRYQTARDLHNDLEDLQRETDWGARPTSSIIDNATRTDKPVSEVALTRYRESRIREWMQPRYKLDREFVALTLLEDRGEDCASGRWDPQTTVHRDLGNLLAHIDDPAIVVLGSPGCGKSTLLRRLELEVAQKGLADSAQPMTFFIQLNRYRAETPGELPPPPFQWLSERWASRNPTLPPFADLLRTGRMILLLDALNEMPTADAHALHQAVLQWKDFLDHLVHDFPGTRVVFSCRTLDYSAPLSTPQLRVPQVVIEPLTDAQVEQFLLKQSPDQGEAIWQQINGTPQMELLRSPYFLSLLADQVAATGAVPEGRAGLFTGFVRQSLRREVERGGPLFSPDILLTERDLRRITQWKWKSGWELPERGALIPKLSQLAFAMQDQGGGGGQVRMEYDDALDLLDHDQDEKIIKAGLALSVLDEDPGADEVLYVHQLVQEYFAARELARDPDPQRVRVPWLATDIAPALSEVVTTLPPGESLPPLERTGWEETTVLAAAMTADPDSFVRDIMATNLVVAGHAAGHAEVRERLSPSVLDDLRSALMKRSCDTTTDLRARIEAGLALGPLGDPRFELCDGPHGKYLMPPMARIPAGIYPMGTDETLLYLGRRIKAHQPRHEVELAEFHLACHLVTNGQWACFMAAGGYDNQLWWDTHGAKRWLSGEGTTDGTHANLYYWREQFEKHPEKLEAAWSSGQVPEQSYQRWHERLKMTADQYKAHLHELYPGGKMREPKFWRDSRFNNPSQPVVGISWYEARAFTNWLSAQTGKAFRLPSEVEWEAAARGLSGRRYAWGEEFGALLGNTVDTKASRTTPVGIFSEGQTPEGVSDLTGNVDEWTVSLFGTGADIERADFGYPYDKDDGREDPDAGPEIRRVLRGGTWYRGEVNARAAYRYEAPPDFRDFDFGFRVAFDA